MLLSRLLIASACAIGLATIAAPDARACDGMHQQTAKVTKVSAEQLATLLDEKVELTLLDANGAQTRAKLGVIPGARLLSSSLTYDVNLELPRDRTSKLVFYCATSRCSAAPKAAQRALDAGFTDVNVLSVGVKGWADAGSETTHPTTS